MWRHVRALGHVTHVAQIAVVHDLPVIRFRDAVDLHRLGVVDQIEQRRECVAQAETTPASVTNVVNAFELTEQRSLVAELRALPIDRRAWRRSEAALPPGATGGLGHTPPTPPSK